MNEWLCKLGTGKSSHILVEDEVGSIPVVEEFDREVRTYNGKVFVSEVGYGGMSDLDETVAGFNGRDDLLDAKEMKAFRDSLYVGFRKKEIGSSIWVGAQPVPGSPASASDRKYTAN